MIDIAEKNNLVTEPKKKHREGNGIKLFRQKKPLWVEKVEINMR